MQMAKTMKLDKKVVDDVLGGPEAWKNVDQTSGTLPHRAVAASHGHVVLTLHVSTSSMPEVCP